MTANNHRIHSPSLPLSATAWPARLASALLALPALLLGVHLASAETRTESLNRAIQAQEAIIRAAPEDADGYKDLGNLLALQGNVSAAEEVYRRALELDPSDASSHYDLALLLARERPQEAAKLLRASIDLDPESAWAHYTLGTLQQRAGRRKAAIRSFATAFALNPELALQDVNPQVISNPDATAALLEARHLAPISTAPRIYGDPGRIANLLTDDGSADPQPADSEQQDGSAPEGGDARTAAPPDDAAQSGAGSAPASAGRPATPPVVNVPPDQAPTPRPGDPTGANARRSLNSEDLRGARDVNQATPQPGGRGPIPDTGGSPGEMRPSTRGPSPGSPARFRPGRRSSASLSLELEGAGTLGIRAG